MKEKSLGLAKILYHTCRYTDDICVVNCNFFDRQLHKIYPDSLIVNRGGNDCTVAPSSIVVQVYIMKLMISVSR